MNGYDLDGTLCVAPPSRLKPYARQTGPERRAYDAMRAEHYRTAPLVRRPEDGPFVIITGRSERYRPQTEEWLAAQGLTPVAVEMLQESRTRQNMIAHKLAACERHGVTTFYEDDPAIAQAVAKAGVNSVLVTKKTRRPLPGVVFSNRDPVRYQEEATKFAQLFTAAVEPFKDRPLFLSGGIDSVCILAALLELNVKPVCYHFCVEGWPGDDLAIVKDMARVHDLDLRVVTRPRNYDQLIGDVRWLLGRLVTHPKYKPSRTTVIQCCHVTLSLVEAAVKDGFDRALMGVGGVTDDTRRCAVAYHENGDAGADPFRRYTLLMGNVPLEEEVNPINAEIWLAGELGVDVAQPFAEPVFAEWLLSLPWAVVNFPRVKGIGVRAFPWFWGAHRWYWRNCNMHVGSGMREWHNTLIDSPVNTRGLKTTAGIYRDLLAPLLS